MAYDSLKSLVRQYIKTNAENEITGQILQNVLITMIDELGSEYSIEGIATPSTNPGSPSGKAMYFASQAGTYTYFDGATLPLGIHLLVYNGTSWSHQTFFAVDATPTSGSSNFISSGAVFDAFKNDGGAYDVSVHFPTGGVNGGNTYDLADAIAKVPSNMRKGGMSIKFVQSSDNKYVQYRLMSDSFNTTVANWQGVDEKPIAGSDNLVKSEGLELSLSDKVIQNPGKNLLNPDVIYEGHYINSGGGYSVNPNYNVSGLIPVEEGTYYLSAGGSTAAILPNNTHINLYDSNKNLVSTIAGGIKTLNISSGVSYFRTTVYANATDVQIERGSARTVYEPYNPIGNYNAKIDDGTITENKLAENSVSNSKVMPSSLGIEKLNFTVSINLVVPQDIQNKKYHHTTDYAVYSSNDAYIATGLIPVKPNTIYYFKNFSDSENHPPRFVEFFNSSKERISDSSNLNSETSPSTAAYVIVTFYKAVSGSSTIDEIYVSETIYGSTYIPYQPFIPGSLVDPSTFANGSIVTSVLEDGCVTQNKLAENSVSNSKVMPSSLGIEKLNFTVSINLVVPQDIQNKKYHHTTDYAYYSPNDSYIATGLIPVKPNTIYYFKNFSDSENHPPRFVEFFNSSKERISDSSYHNSEISPSTAAYVIVTFNKAVSGSSTIDDLYVSETIYNTYIPYQPVIPGSVLKDGSVTQDKLAGSIHINAKPSGFGLIESALTTLASGSTLNTPLIHGYKNIAFIVQIDSEFEEVKFGVDKNEFYQIAFIVDTTTISCVTGSASDVQWTENHGLTLGSKTVILVVKGIGADSGKIKLINDEGEIWEKQFTYGSKAGLPYIINNGQSSITVKIGYELRDINEKIWLFGDSYFDYNNNFRWPYYLVNDNFTRYLMSARGGDNPQIALSSFTNLLATGARPSFAVWCMGMNGTQDSGDTPDASWLTPTTLFISLCEEYGITPIISTIPTVPSRNHAARNAWVRSHSYRYIDFAFAVEVSGSDYWKNWGTAKAMLSSDKVHPTGYGAKALYQQVIRDFPEIMVTC